MKRQRKEKTKNRDDRATENMQERHKRKKGGKTATENKGQRTEQEQNHTGRDKNGERIQPR